MYFVPSERLEQVLACGWDSINICSVNEWTIVGGVGNCFHIPNNILIQLFIKSSKVDIITNFLLNKMQI